MKLLFISDIHGSLYYTRKALTACQNEKADYMVILGDILYHGARNPLPEEYNPREVTQALNAYADKIIAIRGNCDSEVDEMVLDFPIMSAYSTILYNTGLNNTRRLFLTHGHLYHEGSLPKLGHGDVFFYGHTHIPVAEKKGNIFVINPGSITLPKENNPHTYGVLDGNSFLIKDFEGSVFKELVFP